MEHPVLNFIYFSGMPWQRVYIWKQAPFLRLFLPLISGILMAEAIAVPLVLIWIILSLSIAFLLVFNRRTGYLQFWLGWINGVFIHLLIFGLGLLLFRQHNISNSPKWIKANYKAGNMVLASLQEHLSERAKTYKTIAKAEFLFDDAAIIPVSGNIIIYFKKDSALRNLNYGTKLVFKAALQPIKNTGNPGDAPYQQYAAFQDIHYQVYLEPETFFLLPDKEVSVFKNGLLKCREWIITTLKTNIKGEKEAGLAEALLIGYKEDLDKEMLQSYSNTGVVHIIAISGLHLGLLYMVLQVLLKPFFNKNTLSWLRPLFIIIALWSFAFLTGGSPSILRAALMFSFILMSEWMGRKSSIYNSLAASAFLLLCINSNWLWNIGYQLSYAAVLSIVIFMQPIYSWLRFENKLVDGVWKLCAVTLSAQVLTFPVCVYYFHQFPIYFLFSNLLAVPLSSLILLVEIGLCCLATFPLLAKGMGTVLHHLIVLMNEAIGYLEKLPLANWQHLQIGLLQLYLLYGCTLGFACWWLWKNKTAFLAGLLFLLAFFTMRSIAFIKAARQRVLVVYNLPRRQAIDFIIGRDYFFKGDPSLKINSLPLKPSRTLYRIQPKDSLSGLLHDGSCLTFRKYRIVLIDSSFRLKPLNQKIKADLLILTANPAIKINELQLVFDCKQFVIDGSNPGWKHRKWMEEVNRLGLNCYSVVDKAAFVMQLD